LERYIYNSTIIEKKFVQKIEAESHILVQFPLYPMYILNHAFIAPTQQVFNWQTVNQ
jgi:hypothetical protein